MGEPTSSALKLFGTDEPVPETPLLRAGPLEATLDAGNLRHIKLGGREAIRAISYIVRDRNWGTYNPEITNLQVDQDQAGFRVTYDAVCRDAQQAFAYRATITADARGRLSFVVDGGAQSDFITNRTGFVVLHPVDGVSGAPVEVLHVDGTVEHSQFPALIDPACPFQGIRALTHEVQSGVRVTCRMEGDTFEMEDQRNWMDASYKTYVRPLALPWPYTIEQGQRFTQSVTLAVEGALPTATAAGASPVSVSVGQTVAATMPAVGLALPAAHVGAALAHVELLRLAAPAFLVGGFDARQGHAAALLRHYAEVARRTGAELVLEVVLPCVDASGQPTDDLEVLRSDLRYVQDQIAHAGVQPARIAVSPASDLQCTLPGGVWPKAPSWDAIAAAARVALPGLPLGGGMFSYFTELNRKRPPAGPFDFVCHTTCPIVHAGDDLSLTEGLEALPYIFASTKAFAGDAPYWLFPTTIAMRQNPYGAAPAENPDGGRVAMARVDPREHALIGAAWYAGYLAHAARAGLAGITLAAAAGPAGIIEPDGKGVQPSFHVIRGHAALAGAAVLETRISTPREVQALAVRTSNGLVLWLTNLTGRQQQVRLEGLASDGRALSLQLLDETSVEALGHDPESWDSPGRQVTDWTLELPPYAVAALRPATV